MANIENVVCKIAQERHKNAARWRFLWTTLLWVFGASVVIFLVLSVLFFLRLEWLPGALTTLGTIVEGVGIKWVLDRRGEALKEEEDAFNDVKESCKSTQEAEEYQSRLTVFGKHK